MDKDTGSWRPGENGAEDWEEKADDRERTSQDTDVYGKQQQVRSLQRIFYFTSGTVLVNSDWRRKNRTSQVKAEMEGWGLICSPIYYNVPSMPSASHTMRCRNSHVVYRVVPVCSPIL